MSDSLFYDQQPFARQQAQYRAREYRRRYSDLEEKRIKAQALSSSVARSDEARPNAYADALTPAARKAGELVGRGLTSLLSRGATSAPWSPASSSGGDTWKLGFSLDKPLWG